MRRTRPTNINWFFFPRSRRRVAKINRVDKRIRTSKNRKNFGPTRRIELCYSGVQRRSATAHRQINNYCIGPININNRLLRTSEHN